MKIYFTGVCLQRYSSWTSWIRGSITITRGPARKYLSVVNQVWSSQIWSTQSPRFLRKTIWCKIPPNITQFSQTICDETQNSKFNIIICFNKYFKCSSIVIFQIIIFLFLFQLCRFELALELCISTLQTYLEKSFMSII